MSKERTAQYADLLVLLQEFGEGGQINFTLVLSAKIRINAFDFGASFEKFSETLKLREVQITALQGICILKDIQNQYGYMSKLSLH